MVDKPAEVRLTLEELQLSYSLHTVDLFKREHHRRPTPKFLHVNAYLPFDWTTDVSFSPVQHSLAGSTLSTTLSDADSEQTEAPTHFYGIRRLSRQAGVHFMNRVILPAIGKEPDL